MDDNQALSVLHDVQKEMLLWADLDKETKPLCERYEQAIEHFEKMLSASEFEGGRLILLTTQVAKKLGVSYDDARKLIFDVIGESQIAMFIAFYIHET